MTWVRNLLISIGAFWLSSQLVVLASITLGRVANGITYGDNFVAAIAMGIMDSTGRSVCAAFGAAIVTLAATGVKPHRWAVVVALLYAIAAQPRFHWNNPPTTWDRIWQTANILWPAVVCLITAFLIAKFRRRSSGTAGDEIPNGSA